MSYVNLSDFIDQKTQYIDAGVESAEKNIKEYEKIYENIMKKNDTISRKDYLNYYEKINAILSNANNNIIQNSGKNKGNIFKKVKEHLDHVLEKNRRIKTIAKEALVKLNAKYIKPQNLQSLSAHILKSQGVTADDLPSPEKGVFERITSSKGGNKTVRRTSKARKQKTKKCL